MGMNSINNSVVYNSFYTVKKDGKQSNALQNPTSKTEQIYNKPIASLSISEVTPKEKKSVKGWIIGIGSLVATLGVASLFLTRGASGKLVSKLNNLISKIDDKIYQNASQNKAAGFAQKTMLFFANATKKLLHGFKVIANFTPFKDIPCNKLFTNKYSKKLGLHKIPEWCTNFSRKMTMATNTKLARNVQGGADDLAAYVKGIKSNFTPAQLAENITIDGKTLTRAKWLEEAQKHADDIRTMTQSTFSTSARSGRFAQMDSKIGDLNSSVKKALFSKDAKNTIFNGYVTENMTATARKELTDALQTQIKLISNNIKDVSGRMNDSLSIIRGSIANSDRTSVDYARKFAKQLSEFQGLQGLQEATQRTVLVGKMQKTLQSLKASLNGNSLYNKAAKENFSAQCDLIGSILKSHEKGATEHLHTILKNISDTSSAQKHVKEINKFTTALNKATKFETDTYLRQAELKLGAAFTDIGFLALTAGSGVVATCKENSTEGKISKGLTLGIPLIGTTGLCLWQTALGMTGIAPLALSFLGGLILSKAGSAVSDKYLASNNKKQQLYAELNSFRNAGQAVIKPFVA